MTTCAYRSFPPVVWAALCLAAAPSAVAGPPVWGFQTVASSGNLNTHNGTSIALDASRNPRIAYYEGTDGDLAYAEKTLGVWTWSVVDTTGNTGQWPSLALDASDEPHIAYYWKLLPDGDPAANLVYAWREAGSWNIETVDSNGSVGQHCALAIDSSGTAHITYFDVGGPALKYAMKPAGGSWTVATVDASGNVGDHAAMVLDAAGNLHVAYQDVTNSGLRYATRVGGMWSIEEIASVNTLPAFTLLASNVSIDVDSAGQPHVMFLNELSSKSMYAVREGGVWSTGVARSVGLDLHGAFHSLVIDGADLPTVAYHDLSFGELRLATTQDGRWWTPEPVTTAGVWTSLAIDPLGHPHISYHATFDTNVMYAVKSDVTSSTGSDPRTHLLMTASPNPMSVSTTLFVRTSVTIPFALSIVDARGRLVRRLVQHALPPGAHQFSWDGRNEAGRRVGAGIYFAVVRPEQRDLARKIVVLR